MKAIDFVEAFTPDVMGKIDEILGVEQEVD
jgi:hypothetical protein